MKATLTPAGRMWLVGAALALIALRLGYPLGALAFMGVMAVVELYLHRAYDQLGQPRVKTTEPRITVMGHMVKLESSLPHVDPARDEAERRALEWVYLFLSRGEHLGYTRRALVGTAGLSDERWRKVRHTLLSIGDLVIDGKSARLPAGANVDELLLRWGIDRSGGQPRYRPQDLDVHRLSALARLTDR